jgi:phage terminase small subunit
MALSNKQRIFIEEYLRCWNATEAARRAGYSETSARVIGHENLTKPDISEEIQRRIDDQAMSANEVLCRLADQARGTIEDYISFNHAPHPTFTLDLDKARQRGVLHLIKKLKYNSDGYPEIELYDVQAALVMLGKHHKLFTDKIEHDLSDRAADSAAALIAAMRQGAKEDAND